MNYLILLAIMKNREQKQLRKQALRNLQKLILICKQVSFTSTSTKDI